MADATPVRTIAADAPSGARPNFERPEYVAGKPARRLSRAMMEGTRGIRALGEEAMPKWPGEDAGFYKIRASIVRVARYYKRTVQAIVGMVVGTPPTLAEDTAPILIEDAEDIDGQGTHFEVFARRTTLEAAVGGYSAILVDAPPVPLGMVLTLADEQALGLRPYWALIRAEQIINWVVEAPDWLALLTAWQQRALTTDQVRRLARHMVTRQVTIHEPADVRDGDFGVRTVNRYRVLTLDTNGVRFAIWEQRQAQGTTGEHYALIAEGPMLGGKRQPLPAIPLSIAYSQEPQAPFVCEPLAQPVAELNLDHYQLSAERRYLLRITHAPTLGLFGFEDDLDEQGNPKPIAVGPNAVLKSRNPDADAKWISAEAGALSESREERDDVVEQIAAIGASFLGRDEQRGAETARGRALDMAAEHQMHALLGRGVQDALEQAWVFHAHHRNVDPPSIEMHTVQVAPEVNPQVAQLLWQAVIEERLDMDQWLAYLRTGVVPQTFERDAAEILAAAEAARAAEAERKRQQGGAGADDGGIGDNLDQAA